ncbi:protein of unknown function [Cupriavidus neocaledonicus]|uniref:Uncharacterized protein n=1 Tax=Cupriavidus neocaledonicus TaxID=1040979 RepID=A0A375H1Q7_9BURK|nr:hypothetical protein CBM2605_A60268 [Cupriavidus neocaledonicus]SPD45602.1 protein of unknown function [Cupriavidus neocaledonicus]
MIRSELGLKNFGDRDCRRHDAAETEIKLARMTLDIVQLAWPVLFTLNKCEEDASIPIFNFNASHFCDLL